MDIVVLVRRENDTANKALPAFKNGLFSANLGTRTISLFAMYTIIGTNTRSNHCCRYGWPSLYLFVGKTTQPTKRAAPIVHSKMDFSQQFWEQNDRSFCNVHNVMIQETLHIPGGEEKAFLVLQESWWELPW